MSRPTKAGVDYFPHDCRHGKSLFIVDARFGNDGYATWYRLQEALGEAPGHWIDARDTETWEYLSARCRVPPDRLATILELFARLTMIDADLYAEGLLWSQDFVDGLAELYRKRKRPVPTKPAREPDRAGVPVAITPVLAPETPAGRDSRHRNPTKKSRVEKSKEKTGRGRVLLHFGKPKIPLRESYFDQLVGRLGREDAVRVVYRARAAADPVAWIQRGLSEGYAMVWTAEEEANKEISTRWFESERSAGMTRVGDVLRDTLEAEGA